MCRLIIEYLALNNENIWKLLKYNTPDALSKPDLTIEEKSELIYNNEPDSTSFRVFRQSFVNDAFSEQQSQLRVYMSEIIPTNHVHGMINFIIDLPCHNQIITLDDYLNRNEVMANEILKTLNGIDINGLGKLFFDRRANAYNIARLSYFNKWYQGFSISLSIQAG